MKYVYVMFADGNTMKRKDIRKAVLHQAQNGKKYRMISSVHYVSWVRNSFRRSKK